MKIATVIGARPQFIKAAAVSRSILTYNRRRNSRDTIPISDRTGSYFHDCHHQTDSSLIIEEILIHTGQHYDESMSAVFFRELEIPEPQYNLAIGSGPHGRQTGQMLAALEEVLLIEQPDWVLIYGDTNSTLAGALAAAKLHIPIAHVESGLRSFNRRMPEEINRVIADQLSSLLLCPSQVAAENLAAEGICKNVVVTGDVMADALQFAETKASVQSNILSRLTLQPQDYLLATVHRAENTDNTQHLSDILMAFASLEETVVFPAHPRTRKLLNEKGYQPPHNVLLMDPVGYFDTIALEKSARMLLTDSGGMQKEAYWLRVPCVTLRDETEWVETVEVGWNILTGADHSRIVAAVRDFQPPADHPPLYGDGQAAVHCMKALLESFSDHRKERHSWLKNN